MKGGVRFTPSRLGTDTRPTKSNRAAYEEAKKRKAQHVASRRPNCSKLRLPRGPRWPAEGGKEGAIEQMQIEKKCSLHRPCKEAGSPRGSSGERVPDESDLGGSLHWGQEHAKTLNEKMRGPANELQAPTDRGGLKRASFSIKCANHLEEGGLAQYRRAEGVIYTGGKAINPPGTQEKLKGKGFNSCMLGIVMTTDPLLSVLEKSGLP